MASGLIYGVLSKLQRSHQPGWPMGSLAPFALASRGEPLITFSALAEHTKNVLADPRASLFAQAAAEARDIGGFGAATWIPGSNLLT